MGESAPGQREEPAGEAGGGKEGRVPARGQGGLEVSTREESPSPHNEREEIRKP